MQADSATYFELATATFTENTSGVLSFTASTSGIHTVFLDPHSTGTGSVTLQLSAAQGAATGVVAIDGESTAVSLQPGQNGRYTFSGTEGQRLGLAVGAVQTSPPNGHLVVAVERAVSGSTFAVDLACDGGAHTAGVAGLSCNLAKLPVTGSYTLVLTQGQLDAQATTAISLSSEAVAAPLQEGVPTLLATTRPGQNASATFSAVAGHRYRLSWINSTLADGDSALQVQTEAGGSIASTPLNSAVGTLEFTASTSGVHRVLLDPARLRTGSLLVTLRAAPSDAMGEVVIDGASTTVTLASDQNGRYTFTGSIGQRLGLAVSPLNSVPANGLLAVTLQYSLPGFPMQIPIYLNCGSSNVAGVGGLSCNVPALIFDGVYTVVLSQAQDNTSMDTTLSLSTEAVAAPLQMGVPTALTTHRPGQNASAPFSAMAGQALRLFWSHSSLTDGASLLQIQTAQGVSIGSANLNSASGSVDFTPPVTGNYEVFLDPYRLDVGSVSVTIGAALANQPPVAALALPDQSAMQGATLSFTLPEGAFTDPDASDTLTYSASLGDGAALPAWLGFNASTPTLHGTVPLGTTGELAVRFTATDAAGAQASSLLTLRFTAPDFTAPVYASATHTLADGYFNLVLIGTDAIDGTGNALNNQITGNAAANQLAGLAGNDTLSGGAGDDTYLFNPGDGVDTIIELPNQGHDTLRLGEGISPTPGSIRTSREGSDLILSFGAAGNDKVRMPGYFDVDGGTVEAIAFANGKVWSFHNVMLWMAIVDAPVTKVKYLLRRASGDELDLVHPVAGLGQASAPVVHVVNGSGGDNTLHIGAGMHVDARIMGPGADSIYFPSRLDDYLQAIDQDTGIYTLAHRTRTSEVILFTSMGDDDVLHFADGHIVFNALTDARLYDENTGVFLPILASYLLPGGTPVNAPDATLSIQGIADTTLSATLSRPLATILTDTQVQSPVATGQPMLVHITGLQGQAIAPLQRSGQAMNVVGGAGSDSVYVTPGTALVARSLGSGDDRIYFTGQLNDYTQAIDLDTGIYTFTHKTRPTEVVQLTSMGEDDELWFADGHIVFNALDDARLYNETTGEFMAIQAEWLSPGGTPILTEWLEYSTDGGATWQDATASVNGTTVTLTDPALGDGSAVRLRVSNRSASGATASPL